MGWDHSAVHDHSRPSPLVWAHSRSLSIVIIRPGEVGGDRWGTFVRSFAQNPTTRLLLFVLGAVDLPPTHRRALTHAIGERPVAAIVDTVVGRGMVTSLSWSGISIESYPISRIREAIAALDPESEGESIDQCLDFAARMIDGADATGQLRDKFATVSRYRVTFAR